MSLSLCSRHIRLLVKTLRLLCVGLTLADHIVLTKYYRQRMPTYSLHPVHIVTVLKQQTEAIQHLQICNVFHCDFKPENVLYNE